MEKKERAKKPSKKTIVEKNKLKKDESSLKPRKKLKSTEYYDFNVVRKGNKKYKPSNQLRGLLKKIKLHEYVARTAVAKEKGKIKLKIIVDLSEFEKKPFNLIFECANEDQLMELAACASQTIDRKIRSMKK